MSNQYWLICVPNEQKNEKNTRAKLDSRTEGLQLSTNKTFKLPDNPQLKVGTIDQLMQLSDELTKIDTFVEATVKKIERTCVDIVRSENREQRERDAAAAAAAGTAAAGTAAADGKTADPKAGGKSTNPGAKGGDSKANAPPAADLRIERVMKDNTTGYLTQENALEDFVWDMRRYHSSKGITALSDIIFKSSGRADDELKNKLAEFNDLKQNVTAIERKEGGSLLVRPLGEYVRKTDIFEQDYITTLLVVVPKVKETEFLTTYEFLEAEALQREKAREEERKAAKARDAETKKAVDEAKLKAEKKKHAVAVQAQRDHASAGSQAAAVHADAKESEEETKRREEEKKAQEDEAKAEAKRRDDEAEKKKKEEERRYACWNVVPGSAKKLTRIREGDAKSPKATAASTASAAAATDDGDDDDEFVLYRVVVMRKGADSYRNLLRDKRYTVRPFKYDPAEDKSQKDKKKQMDVQKANLYRSLVGWCNATFSDMYNAWLHIKAMRIFVEAVLRYGLPIDFQCVLLRPKRGLEKKLREALSDLYSKLSGDASLAEQLDSGEQDLSGTGADFYPYVYLPVTLSEIAPEKQ